MQKFATALVTGASSGIGEAFCRELAGRGSDLVLVARRADRLERLARELRSRHGVEAEILAADLIAPEGLRSVEKRLSDPGRPIDLLVNGAGVFGEIAPLPHQDEEAQIRLIGTNVTAIVRLTRAAVWGMVRRRRGAVLNLASAGAFLPAPGGATYAASKAFVMSFSQSVHGEVMWLGVSVTALCPGSVRTSINSGAAARHRLGRVTDPAVVVRAGLAAAEAGKPLHVPGLGYRLTAAMSRWGIRLARRRRYRSWGRRAAAALAGAAGSAPDEITGA